MDHHHFGWVDFVGKTSIPGTFWDNFGTVDSKRGFGDIKIFVIKIYIIRMPTTSDSGQRENQDIITNWRKYELLGKSVFLENVNHV